MTVGLNYEINKDFSKSNFSIGQIISEKKNNKNMSDTSSLDKIYDIYFNYDRGEKFSLKYNVLLDQNYSETKNDVR